MWEETVKCTTKAAGVWVLISIHRDNDGKVLLPAGMATTSKDPPYSEEQKRMGGFRNGA
ncbi:MAG: hypothetical protein ACYDEJ_13775 [Desulfitobacteriaceae bacterium]